MHSFFDYSVIFLQKCSGTKGSSILDRLCCDLFGYRLLLLLSSTPARTPSGDLYQEFIAAIRDSDLLLLGWSLMLMSSSSASQGPPPT